jgi:methylthioribose-1-phosphate isomerase
MLTAQGSEIEIEERGAVELTHIQGIEVGAKAASVYNPVFDVTPADCIDFIITEKGVIKDPDGVKMAACFSALSSP